MTVTVPIVTTLQQPPVIKTELAAPPVIKTVLEVGQGPAGPPGIPGVGGSAFQLIASVPLSSYMVIAVNGIGQAIYADPTNASHGILQIGISLNSVIAGDLITIARNELLTHLGWNFNVGPIFIGLGGQLVQTLHPSSVFVKAIGWALSPTQILVNPQPSIYF